MKKINKYYLNEGMGGVILAKSLKQAMKKVVHVYRPDTVKTLVDHYKEYERYDEQISSEYFLEVDKVAKKGENKKSMLIGFSE